MNNSSDTLFAPRLADMLRRCERDCCSVFSRFLDERQCAEAELWCRKNAGELHYGFFGGFPDARRRILALYHDYSADYIREELPIVCLTFTFREEDKLDHRSFLGSFLALGLKRDTIGDIVIKDAFAQAAVTETAARDITASISRIGRVGVKITDSLPFELTLEEAQQFREIGCTVASLRLDCIAAAAAGLSREKAASLIRCEKAEVNHLPVTSLSYELKEGDVLSLRGSGRFILSGINGISKKGRIHIILKKYI
ncbi:MAG: RNA-binding protein [Ruminococcus sp.]|nr:RNA-binding protein [Ruminococcus sp.]